MSNPDDKTILAEQLYLENVGLLAGGLDAFEKRYNLKLEKVCRKCSPHTLAILGCIVFSPFHFAKQ